MRTNVHLNDELLDRAMRLSGLHSKRAVIEHALKTFVDSKSAESRRESYRRKVAEIQEKTKHLKFTESVVDIIRRDRDRDE